MKVPFLAFALAVLAACGTASMSPASAGPLGGHLVSSVSWTATEAHPFVLVNDDWDDDGWDRHRYRRDYYRGNYVDAPFTRVETYRGRVAVDAPFASVRVGRRGTWVRAPFVNIYVPR